MIQDGGLCDAINMTGKIWMPDGKAGYETQKKN